MSFLSVQKLDNTVVTVLPRGDGPINRLVLSTIYPWRKSPGADPIMKIPVYNTHLSGFSASARDLQLHALKSLLPSDGPVVILGDFNAEPKVIDAILLNGTNILRVPVEAPTETATYDNIDHIYYRGLCLGRYGVANTVGASDHLPVWAEFDKPNSSGQCAT